MSRKILILIPHPDDEVVGCAAALHRARQEGAALYGLYLSHGCLARETLWPWQRASYEKNVARRLKEGASVAAHLGLTLLEGNTRRAAREIWLQLDAVYEEVMQALDVVKPDAIWVPAYEGGNPDHDAINALASTLRGVTVMEFAAYHNAEGHIVSNRFIAPRGDDITLTLTPEEQALKRAALKLYASEQGNLGAIACAVESLRPLPSYDYTKLPHEGPLGYARFQWVPFRHPRVDFTKPETVCAAISAFLQTH